MTVGYRPKRLCGGGKDYKTSPLEVIPVGIQRLVLLCPAEELSVKPADLRRLDTEASSAEVNLNFAKEILEELDIKEASEEKVATKKASKEELDINEASEEEVDIKASEETVAEDVLADDNALDFADNSAEGLEAELQEQSRAQLSSPPLPDPRRSAEQATQGRGIFQVTLCSKQTSPSTVSNSDSSPCNNEYLA